MKAYAVRRHLTWHPASWQSAIVRMFTGCRFNHSIIIHEIYGVEVVTEAAGNGVVTMPFSEWAKKYPHTLMLIPLKETPDPLKLVECLGKKYDLPSLVWHQVKRQLYRWFEIDHWSGKKGLSALDLIYCSELIGYVWGLPDYDRITTGGIIEYAWR